MEVEPGATKDKKKSRFVGLETPPVVRTDVPGRRFVLLTDQLGSLSGHSPINFRGIKVGEILGYELAPDRTNIRVYAFVRAPYDKFVLNNSSFWNISGVEVVAGTDGIKVRMESIQSLLSGGVSFEANLNEPDSEPAAENKEFPLYANREAIREAAIVEAIPYVVHFDDSVRGLGPGAPVDFRGVRVGTVRSIRPEVDLRRRTVHIADGIVIEPQRLTPTADVIGDPSAQPKYALIAALVEQGLRAQLRSGSLITGQQIVSLDFHPDDPPKKLDMSGKIPEIPTVGTPLNELMDSVSSFLDKLNKLPLDALVGDIRTTIRTLDGTLGETKTLVQSTRGQLGPTLTSFQQAATAARDALTQAQSTLASADGMVGENSEIRESLATTLRELAGAARSIRDLGDYLERHPEALVKGKIEQR
jgi:paraquat-inducible protein B